MLRKRVYFFYRPVRGLKSKLFVFSFSGCSTKLGIINKDDVEEIRKGENVDKISLKMALGIISLCTNLHSIRNEPTKKAIDFLQSITNGNYNVNKIIRKRPRLTYRESSVEDGEITAERIETKKVNESTIEHKVECSITIPKDFDLDDFVSDIVEEEREGGDLFTNIEINNEPDMIDEFF